MSYSRGKKLNGSIRKGQKWMKLDTGRVMVILGPHDGGRFSVRFDGESRTMRIHALTERDIYKYYVKLK